MVKAAQLPENPNTSTWSVVKPILIIIGGVMSALLLLVGFSMAIDLSQGASLTADRLQIQAHNLGGIVSAAKAADPTPRPPAISDLGKPAPQFNSVAVLAMDYDTGRILYEKNGHLRRSPASTTKLMTALVAVKQYELGQVLTVLPEDAVPGSSMGLHVGETVTFRGLLYGMLLNSGNDAAFTIASNYPGGLPAFVSAMNQQASALGLQDTSFVNPAGFDGQMHYSTAYDLAKIAKAAVEFEQIATVVATKDTSVLAMDQSKEHDLHNLNQLLGETGVLGIKTGTTETSGENFVGLVERNGHKVITVVLGSTDRFGETKNLMNWVYDNFVWNQ